MHNRIVPVRYLARVPFEGFDKKIVCEAHAPIPLLRLSWEVRNELSFCPTQQSKQLDQRTNPELTRLVQVLLEVDECLTGFVRSAQGF